jgi:uncharacterized integral membrane protein
MSAANESKPPARERWRPTRRQIIATVIAVAAVVFISQNKNETRFHFLWFDFRAPLWLWLLMVFGAGICTGLLIASRRAKRKASA